MPFTFDVEGAGRFTAAKVLCVGKNYADHVREMAGTLWSGADADRSPPPEPVLFLKPATSLLPDGGAVVVPPGIGAVHHEVELAVLVGRTLRRASAERALDAVAGYGVALDMTARDLQAAAKRAGLPWTVSKGLDTFCPVSAIAPAERVPDPQAITLTLAVNGAERQRGSTRNMIQPVGALLAHASRLMTLEPGDLVLTGTPAGVGPVAPGDVLEARADGVARLSVTVVGEGERGGRAV